MPVKRPSHRSRHSVPILIAAIGGFTIAGLTGLALAKPSPALSTATNSAIGTTIVVDSHGLTVYELKPETTHHLLCTKANGCFGFWPPVTVASATTTLTAVPGVKGKLGILHRNGLFQITLAGRPLYHFAADGSTRGKARGQGLQGFGGTWHVVTASGPQPPMSPTTSTMPYPAYQ